MRQYLIAVACLLVVACNGGGDSSPNDLQTASSPRRTIDYNLSDFTAVEINGSFIVTIRQSESYRVEVTIDETEAGKLDVRLDGNRLRVGFLPGSNVRADTLRAVIEMPALYKLELTGSNYVDAAGFSGSMLEVSSDGSNVLESNRLRFDLIVADAFGSSLLEFANVTPVPVAHFDLSGSSTAVVNLMDSATVTGVLSGSSALSYYGDGVFFDMSVAPTAIITRLGPTR